MKRDIVKGDLAIRAKFTGGHEFFVSLSAGPDYSRMLPVEYYHFTNSELEEIARSIPSVSKIGTVRISATVKITVARQSDGTVVALFKIPEKSGISFVGYRSLLETASGQPFNVCIVKLDHYVSNAMSLSIDCTLDYFKVAELKGKPIKVEVGNYATAL